MSQPIHPDNSRPWDAQPASPQSSDESGTSYSSGPSAGGPYGYSYPAFGDPRQQPGPPTGYPQGEGFPRPGQSAEPYGQAAPEYGQNPPPFGQPAQYGQAPPPYGQPPQQYGQPPQHYGQPAHGQGGWAPQQAAKRPVWKTVVGWIFASLAILFTLSAVSQLATGRMRLGGGTAAYNIGYLLGIVLIIGVPALVAWLLLRRKK